MFCKIYQCQLLNLHKQENDTDFSIRFKTIRLSKNKTKAGADQRQ
jgi:hypothetical protein